MQKIKNKATKELFEFICFSSEYNGYFIYRLIPRETMCEMGHISNFVPVGMSWEELKDLENEKS